MNFKESQDRLFKKANLKHKILMIFWGWYFTVEHHFRRITKICPHDSSFGAVNGKTAVCIDCMKDIPNPDYNA